MEKITAKQRNIAACIISLIRPHGSKEKNSNSKLQKGFLFRHHKLTVATQWKKIQLRKETLAACIIIRIRPRDSKEKNTGNKTVKVN